MYLAIGILVFIIIILLCILGATLDATKCTHNWILVENQSRKEYDYESDHTFNCIIRVHECQKCKKLKINKIY